MMNSILRTLRFVVASACFSLLGAACAKKHDEGLRRTEVVGHATGIFPSETLSDWASYVLQLSEVTVLGENEITPPNTVFERGEGYIGRNVTLRIGRTFWTSPGITPAPPEIEMTVAGWLFKAPRRIRFSLASSPRIEVGGTYVIPLVRVTRNSKLQWAPLASEAVFAAPGDLIALEDVRIHGNNAIARSLAGQSAADLHRALTAAPVDPVALKYWLLPPEERRIAVARARQ